MLKKRKENKTKKEKVKRERRGGEIKKRIIKEKKNYKVNKVD